MKGVYVRIGAINRCGVISPTVESNMAIHAHIEAKLARPIKKLTTHDEEYRGLGGGLRWLVFYKNPKSRSRGGRQWTFKNAFVSRVDALILRKNLLEQTGPWAKVAIMYTDEEPDYWLDVLNGGVDASSLMGPHTTTNHH